VVVGTGVDSQCQSCIRTRVRDGAGVGLTGSARVESIDGVRVRVGIGEGNGSWNRRWEQASCGSRVNKA
jgi:hypothetical protein